MWRWFVFAGIFEDRADRWEPGAILLGSSLREPFRQVGWKEDFGFMTIASARAGKDRNAIIPNLLIWPGSAFVIDPTGTKAIDPASAQFTEVIGQIAHALVIAERADESSHWVECARMLIAGILAFLVQTQEGATLVDLRRALTREGIDGENLLKEMHLRGGLATAAASMVLAAGANERGGIFATALRSTEWLKSRDIQDTLSRSDFDIRDLKQTGMTVYVVLPPHFLEVHNRLMRLLVNLAVCAVSIGGKPLHPVLFVLDEFCVLGRMPLIEGSAGHVASHGLKLWLFIQHIGQLKLVYGKNWETLPMPVRCRRSRSMTV
jgi:type IV secretion system protein VirD4